MLLREEVAAHLEITETKIHLSVDKIYIAKLKYDTFIFFFCFPTELVSE